MIKPGIKSTEFWLAAVTLIGGFACLIIGAVIRDGGLRETGTAIVVGGGGTYAISRGIAKNRSKWQ